MKVLTSPESVRLWSREQHAAGKTIGFVPTMGYLHEAHLSLIDLAREHADQTVVSIFVNPTQFGPGEDFDSYPRDEDRDLRLCKERGADAVWVPAVDEMYPQGYKTYVEVNELGKHLCGANRPGHFRGVTTIVSKLFNVVNPDVAVFGRKDAQQARILMQLNDDLQFGVKILLGDTLREPSGLAMSSRNVRLKPLHRSQAPVLYEGLQLAQKLFNQGERSAEKLIGAVRRHILQHSDDATVDYIQLVGWNDLEPVDRVTETSLLALAVRFGNVRLIDNILLEIS
ncbi:pantoate--beta-alanine ligase [bacterium]|nr:pantoate--beta-alanine ligase [bacterium]